jgi:hypothetical protein
MSGKGWVPRTIEQEDTMSELSGRITIVVRQVKLICPHLVNYWFHWIR